MTAARFLSRCVFIAIAGAALAGSALAADAPGSGIAGLRADVHLPTKFELRWIKQLTTNQLDSNETPDMLANECNQSMKAAGWSGTIASHPPGASGSFLKGERFVHVTITSMAMRGGSSMDVQADGKLGPGDKLMSNVELPADVCMPASAKQHPGYHGQQMTSVMLHAEKSKPEITEEFRQALTADGWEQASNFDSGTFLQMGFRKPENQDSVMLTIKPGHTGTGSEVMILLGEVRR